MLLRPRLLLSGGRGGGGGVGSGLILRLERVDQPALKSPLLGLAPQSGLGPLGIGHLPLGPQVGHLEGLLPLLRHILQPRQLREEALGGLGQRALVELEVEVTVAHLVRGREG